MQSADDLEVMSIVSTNVVEMGMIKKISHSIEVGDEFITIELDDPAKTELIISANSRGELLIDVQYGKSEIRTVKVRKSVFDEDEPEPSAP